MATNEHALSGLKVALVHDALTIPGGAEKVLWEFHQLFPHAPIYTPLYRPEKYPEFKQADIRVSSLNRFRYLRNHHQVAIPLFPYAVEQFDLSQFDLVLSDSTAAAKGVLTRPETVHICYCHTPMRWAWLPYLDKRASSSWLRRLTAHYLRIWDTASVNRVDHWIANSQTTANRIKKFYDRQASVIYPPVKAVEGALSSPENQDFYLTVCRLIEGNKRLDVIIEGAKKAEVKLKIVGDGPLRAHFEKLAGNNKDIEFVGFVTNEQRDELYKTCKAFLFASEEDAGIVPIEAMAYGKPVITFGRGGASETVIDRKTGLHFAEQTADSLALAIREFEDMKFDPDSIAKHAQHFSPTRFREEIVTYITQVLDKQEAK